MAMKKGEKFMCSNCGLVVYVDDICGCGEVCDIVCCKKPMKKMKKVKKSAKPAKKPGSKKKK